MSRVLIKYFGFLLVILPFGVKSVEVPGGASVSQVEKLFDKTPEFQSELRGVDIKAAPIADQEFSDDRRFTLRKVLLDGQEIQDSSIMDVIEPYIETSVTFSHLEEMTRELTRHFRSEGYLLSQVVIPKQKVQDGQLNLHVAKGFVDKIEFSGDKSIVTQKIRDHLNKILQEKPLTKKVLERELMLVNELPGMVAVVTFSPSPTTLEAATMDVALDQTHFTVTASLNNDGTKYIGPWQATTGLVLNNTLGNHEQIFLSAGSAPTKDGLKMFGANYVQPIGTHGFMLSLSAQTLRTHPTNALAEINNHGFFDQFIAAVSYPWVKGQFMTIETGLEFIVKNVRNEYRASNTMTEDRLRTVGAYFLHDFSDKWMGQNIFKAALYHGFYGLGSSAKSATNKSRESGRVDFTKMTFLLTRYQYLPYNLGLLFVLEGQWSGSPLLSPERFSVGGAPFNRTYPLAILTGDSGLQGKLEFQYHFTDVDPLHNITLYTYYSNGHIWNRRPSSDEKKVAWVDGMSFGVRSVLTDNVTAFVEYSVPFHKKAGGERINNKTYAGIHVSF